MNWKKIAVSLCAGLFAITAVAAVPSVAMAARGGARISAPRVQAPAARPSTPSTSRPSASPNQREYKPSQNASSIKDQAPSARTGTGTTANIGSRWGNTMRNIGLLAGGMMLGSLLGHLFGFGMGGFMSDILGLLMNVVILCCQTYEKRSWRNFWYSRKMHFYRNWILYTQVDKELVKYRQPYMKKYSK